MGKTSAQDIDRDSFVLRVIIVGLVGLVVALALLLTAQNITDQKFGWLKLLLESLAGTVIVAATVGLIVQRLAHKELLKAMDKTTAAITTEMKTLRAFEELGLIDACSDCNNFSFTDLLLSSKELMIVMNDGKSWVGRNAGLLRKRLLLPDASTILMVQHPDSPMIPVLAHKVEQSDDFIRQKIADTVRELHSFERSATHQLRVLGHYFFNVHTLFMTEEQVAMTPYLITPGRNTTPLFLFERRGQSAQYDRWRHDLEQLLKVSKPLEPIELNMEDRAANNA